MDHPDYFDTPDDIEEEEEEDGDEDDEDRRVTDARLPTPPLPLPGPLPSRVPAWDKSRKPNMQQTIAVLMHDKPIHLLELPVDILEAIIKEITHTNDLCSLAVTCSALHSLTIPHIYSRFDIVWPELAPQSDPRTGVDALTYGLSTLVMASEIFGESPHHSSHNQHPVTCTNCGHVNPPPPPPTTLPTLGHSLKPSPLARLKSRKGNHYALYTRKFSLGNGPKDWVQEYMLYKEAGKLLGTQVALAVARMRNLEQFIWDMPTGILREVWQALSSLEARGDGHPCKLERVWIRWHNSRQSENGEEEFTNMENSAIQGSVPATTSQVHLPAPATSLPETGSKYPTFSILPPLKSLGVVDIDELDYLEEMAVLIGRSRHCLRELRVGIARLQHAANISTASPVPAVGSATRQGHRLGGVMGLLFSHVFSVGPDGISRTPMSDASEQSIQRIIEQAATTLSSVSIATGVMAKDVGLSGNRSAETNAQPANDGTKQAAGRPTKHNGAKFVEDLPRINTDKANKSAQAQPAAVAHDAYEDRLVLQILELERVPLSVFTLKEAIDWTRLREITLLDCAKHESLWKSLRRQYGPSPSAKHTTWQTAGGPSSMASASKLPRSPKVEGFSYPLRIRKIHTNTVSIALLSFINQALPPNSLEVLFLQMSSDTQDPSAVSVEQIYKGPLRRHRESLRKLSIDSTKKSADGKFDGNSRWQHWMVSRTVLDFITSGKMPRLRELCICIDRADWHHFLQRMPFMPHLRALYIPFLTREVEDQQLNDKTTRELAQQILNIVVLRPEVELCYLGLFNKCYEILEGKWSERDAELHLSGASSNDDDDDDFEDEDDDDDDDDHDDDDGDDDASHDSDDDDDLEQADSHDEDSDVEMGESRNMVRLREILFYDDKVAIFKARHGRL